MSFNNLSLEITAAEILKDIGYNVEKQIIQDGKLHRFGKKKNQWYVCFENYIVAGDWQGRLQSVSKFINKSKFDSLGSTEKKEVLARAKELQLEAERQKEILQKEAALKATKDWQTFSQDGDSEYLKRKKVSTVSGIRFGQNAREKFIVVALRNEKDEIINLQKIYDNGAKIFSKDASRSGYSEFGNSDANLIYICEGTATGLSILEAISDSLVIVSHGCGNLLKTAKSIVTKFEEKQIVIAADNDDSTLKKKKNIGLETAESIAKEFGLKLAYPKFKNSNGELSDFNDLHCSEGIDEVEKQLWEAKYIDPEPLLFSSLSYPEIELNPEEVLGKNIITRFANHISYSTETPIEYALAAIFGAIAACVQNKFFVSINNDRSEPLALQIIITGRSGDGKSPVFKHAIKPILNLESEKMPLYLRKLKEIENRNKVLDTQIAALSKAKSEEKFNLEKTTKAIQNLEAKKYPNPISPEIIAQDITPEQIVIQVKERGGKIAILDQEGGVLNTIAGRYSNGIPNFDIMTKGYDGDGYKRSRFGQSIEIPAAYVTLCLFIQPGILTATKNLRSFIDSGFFGRMLLFNPHPSIGYRPFNGVEVDVGCKTEYAEMIRKFFELPNPDLKEIHPQEIRLSREARQIFRNYELEIEPYRRIDQKYGEGAIGSWAEKSKKNAIRIAGILHLVENYNERFISENTMNRAINFIKILTEHATSVFDYIGNTPETIDAIKLLEFIIAEGENFKFSSSVLYQKKRGYQRFKQDKANFDKAFVELQKRKLIVQIPERPKKSVGKKPFPEYRLNSRVGIL